MKKRDKPFRLSKKILECLAVILLFGMTTFAASGGIPGTTTTYSTEESSSADDAVYSTKGGTWVRVDENTWTMDKDNDGTTDVTLVKKGDQWEYLFQTADPNAQYYGWEESVPDGYKVVGKGERKDPATNKTLKYSHTSNISDDGKQSGNYANNLNLNDVITIPGATKLHVKLTYGGEGAIWDWVCMWEGAHPDYTADNNYYEAVSINGTKKFGGGNGTTVECDISGDTVTFGYRSDGSGCGNGYGYYAVVTSGDAPDFSITNEEENVTEPEYGSLKLSKIVAGEGADPSQNFLFEINLTSTDSTLSDKLKGSTTFGDVNFKNGKATVYLKNNDVVELRNIPAGVTWEIKEKATEGYKTEVTAGTGSATETDTSTGVIQKDVTTEVAYTNTKISSDPGGGDTPEDPTGSFKVKKVVKNGDKDDQFDFSAALTGLKAQKDYTVKITETDSKTKNITVTSNAAGTAYVEFKLKADETAEFVNLPIGSNYQIKEEANDYTASYEITDEEDAANLSAVMSQNENYESKKELATQKETLDANEKAVITFTNSKPAPKENTVDIEVEKIWNDNDNSAKLRPSEITVHLYQSTSKDDEGDMIATAKLDESGEWKTTFKEMDEYPTNSTTPYIYTVKEDPVSGYKSEIKGADINTGKKYTITNTLSTVATGDLMLSKTVAGDGADTKKEFRFELTMKTIDDKALQGSFSLDKGKGTKTGTVYFDEDGKATISLKHGESAYITGLPEGAKFNVKETAYEDWTSSLLENTKWNGTIQKNQVSKITVKNTYEAKRQLTVEKTVTGSMGSKTKQFQFQLKLTVPTGKVLPNTLEYTKGEENGAIELKDGVYEFTLAHAEKIVIKGIPSQSSYTVTEVDGESNGYKVTKTNDTGKIKADTTVSFENTKNGSVPTLADMNTKIPFVLVILAIGGVGFLLWKKYKSIKE